MAIVVIDTIEQKNAGTFPVVDANNVKGGHYSVADEAARDAIPAARLTVGMFCYVVDEDVVYKLTDTSPVTWVEFTSGGGGTDNSEFVTVALGHLVETVVPTTIAPASVQAIIALESEYGAPKIISHRVDAGDLKVVADFSGGDRRLAGALAIQANIPANADYNVICTSLTRDTTADLADPFFSWTPGLHKMTVLKAGAYRISAGGVIAYQAESGNLLRQLVVDINDTLPSSRIAIWCLGPKGPNVNDGWAQSGTVVVELDAGDTISMRMAHIEPSASQSTISNVYLQAEWLAPPANYTANVKLRLSDAPSGGGVGPIGPEGPEGPQGSVGPSNTALAPIDIFVNPSTGTDTPGADRGDALTGGVYGRPFMSLSAARDMLPPNYGQHVVRVFLSAHEFDEGVFLQGFSGPAKGLQIIGSWGTPSLTGNADTGTTTTQIKRATGMTAWTPGTYAGQFVRVTGGGGFVSNEPIDDAFAVVDDNDADWLYLRQPVFGLDDTSDYAVVEEATTIAGPASEVYPGLGFLTLGLALLDLNVEVVLRRLRFDAPAAVYGLFTEGNKLVNIQGCRFASGFHAITFDRQLSFSNVVVEGGAYVNPYGTHVVDSYGLYVDNGQIDLTRFNSATFDYAAFRNSGSNPFKATVGDKLALGGVFEDNTASPIIMRSVLSMDIASQGLAGDNPGAPYGIELGGGGQYNLVGAEVSGAADVLIEDEPVPYTELDDYGSTGKYNTVVVWGTGRQRRLDKIFVKADPDSPGDEIATDGDGVFGGQTKNYGFDNELGVAYTTVGAGGTDFATSTALAYRTTIINAASGNNGVHFRYGGVVAADGGNTGKLFNISGSEVALYPAWTIPGITPAATGSINGGVVGASAAFPNNHVAIYNSTDEQSYRVAFLPMDDGLSNLERLQYFGDGSDGVVAVTGAVTIDRDMFYDTLTISGSGSINTNGSVIFCKTLLDLSNAAANAIHWNGSVGNSTTANTAGTTSSNVPLKTGFSGATWVARLRGQVQAGIAGGIGGTSPTSNAISAPYAYGGGRGGDGGNGGSSSAGVAGATGGTHPATCTKIKILPATPAPFVLNSSSLLLAGGGGGGGGGGRLTTGTTTSGGAGSGGAPGGVVAVYARNILRGAGTATGAIAAKGGAGGSGANGADGSAAPTGGGGSGGGGGGGLVHIIFEKLLGTLKTNLIDVSGGNGATGGNQISAAPVSATGGGGGGGGGGGTAILVDLTTQQVTYSGSVATAGTAGSAASGVTGGAGGAGETYQVNL